MRRKIFISIIFLIIILQASSMVVLAENSRIPFYVTPEGDSLKKMFEIRTEDISNPIRWLPYKKSYSLIEQNYKQDQLWLNVPNLQLLAIGKIDGVFSNGYIGSGSSPDLLTEDKFFNTDFYNGNTALKKFGFKIPSPTYIGENSVISYNLSSVLPKGVWGKIKSGIRGIFGGNHIDPPQSAEDYASLYYENVSDYKEDYAMNQWIYENWNRVCSQLQEGQVLLPRSITGNNKGNINGVDYTFKTVVLDHKLEQVSDNTENFNRKLKVKFGQYYRPIMDCIIGADPDYKGSILTNYTLRVMPYNIKIMDFEGSIDLDLVEDPRNSIGAYFESLNIKDKSSISHYIRPRLVNLIGSLSKVSWSLNRLTDFDLIEESGFRFDLLWDQAILKIILYLFAITISIMSAYQVIKSLKGNKSMAEVVSKIIFSMLLLIFMASLSLSHEGVYKLYKNVLKFPERVLYTNLEISEIYEGYINSQASYNEIYEMSFWIPYFESWTKYNTNHELSEMEIESEKFNIEPEQKELLMPKIRDEDSKMWNILLAESFSQGYMVKNDSYRVVDHFMSPRISWDFDSKKIISIENENFNGSIQSQIGWSWMIALIVFLVSLMKLFFFYNSVFEFMFLYIFVIFRYKEYGLNINLMSFGFSIIQFWLASFIIPVVSEMTFYCKGDFLKCTVISLIFLSLVIGFFKLITRGPMWMKPKILSVIESKGRYI